VALQHGESLDDAFTGFHGNSAPSSGSGAAAVAVRRLSGEGPPVLVEPRGPGADLPSWAAANRDGVRSLILREGAVLFRGFRDVTVAAFQDTIRALSGEPLGYTERSSPRHRVAGNVYTSTDLPPSQRIFLHNEQSYNLTWPLHVFFHCVVPPGSGGATPIADCRRVYRRLSAEVRSRFEESGYTYVRNFGQGVGLDWREAFQTGDRDEVERYCRSRRIDFRWRSDTELTTVQTRPAVVPHARTGEPLWFNHLTFFNVSTLGEQLAARLVKLFGRDLLPNNTYHADGSEIDLRVLDELRAAYEAETVEFPWQAGDVLMLDNMLTAHGRAPYTPPRQIVVGMAEPCTAADGARQPVPAES
jgi:alpha-ketoglutarate-dependent taurine dioxygenase